VRGPWLSSRRSSPLAAGKRNSSPHSLTTERSVARYRASVAPPLAVGGKNPAYDFRVEDGVTWRHRGRTARLPRSAGQRACGHGRLRRGAREATRSPAVVGVGRAPSSRRQPHPPARCGRRPPDPDDGYGQGGACKRQPGIRVFLTAPTRSPGSRKAARDGLARKRWCTRAARGPILLAPSPGRWKGHALARSGVDRAVCPRSRRRHSRWTLALRPSARCPGWVWLAPRGRRPPTRRRRAVLSPKLWADLKLRSSVRPVACRAPLS
jgi:hypothetical protein